MHYDEAIVKCIVDFIKDYMKKYTEVVKDCFKNFYKQTCIIIDTDGTVRSIVAKKILKSAYEIPSNAKAGEFYIVQNDDIKTIYRISPYHIWEEVKEFNIQEYNDLKSKVDNIEKLLEEMRNKG